ncbi:MAG TPA: hypothetical protein VL326_11685 [Kofleriaceae bacterium]|nr:hypothetical protein [Kofleriaceae bacterium]
MLRLSIVAVALIGCHHTAPVSSPPTQCPGVYVIKPGACTAAAPTECHGVCGVVVRTGDCTPFQHVIVFIEGTNVSASTNDAGQFDIGPISAGRYKLRVSAEQDQGVLDLDATGNPQTLSAPLELQHAERACECGGDCPT